MLFGFLKTHGLLGINARNLLYIRPFNPEKAIAFADSKLKTKAFLEARGIPVPELYATIKSRRELKRFDFRKLPDRCVLKPNYGYGGEGIRVLLGRRDGEFYDVEGTVTGQELVRNIEDILDAKYAINHTADIAYFEQLLEPHESFTPLKPQGLPDVRVVVFNLVPVMAMLRIPTRESHGTANVHRGGIGLGIDLTKGKTTHAVQYDRLLKTLPDGTEPSGHEILRFQELLLIASRVQQITNIGFVAVDLTLDKSAGPMLLEVNARSGLMVQIANLAPLRSRLERVTGLRVTTPEKGVRLAMDLFGGERVEQVQSKEGKPVLGTRETVEIQGGRKTIRAVAVLRPDHDRTVFDPSLIEELKALDAIEPLETTPEGGLYRVKMLVGGKKLQTVISPRFIRERGARISLGRRDLTSFLLDPGKLSPAPLLGGGKDMMRVDHQLAEIDQKIRILRFLRPENLSLERERTLTDERYNPQLHYPPLDFDPEDLLDRLSYLRGDDSPLGLLLERKRAEIIQKIALIRARGDTQAFVACSSNLYGRPTPGLLREARHTLSSWTPSEQTLTMLPSEKVKERLEEVLKKYSLHDWHVNVSPSLVPDCAIGRNVLLLREGAEFSEARVESLIVHEIETHILTAHNGERQSYELLRTGCAGYLETQEGMAVVNESRVLPEDHEKRVWSALGVLAVHYALTHSFAETRAYVRSLGFDDRRALRTCFKVKRGLKDTSDLGAFTRELLYLRGKLLVEEFLRGGGDLRQLYIGKIHIPDLPQIQQLSSLLPPAVLPAFLREMRRE